MTDGGFAVYNRKGTLAPVVHQTDRRWQLRSHLEALLQERLKRLLMDGA